MELILDYLLAYLISLAANVRCDSIAQKREKKLKEKLDKDKETLRLTHTRISLDKQLQLLGTRVAKIKNRLGVTKAEAPLFDLLTDEIFQSALGRWLRAWDTKEKEEAQDELKDQMAAALRRAGRSDEHIQRFRAEYFDLIEKEVFQDPILANWRLNMALEAVLERLEELKIIIQEEGKQTRQTVLKQQEEIYRVAAELSVRQAQSVIGCFTPQQLKQAEKRYRELLLESCDIINLDNLPESDRHIAIRQIELRRLYVPLRIHVGAFIHQDPLKKSGKLQELSLRNDSKQEKKEQHVRAPVGERLGAVNRLVILGEPGSGKTTLVRWIATAYLLRLKQDPAFKDLPDIATLPKREWLPIVIRCRDLEKGCKTGSIDDVLCETFRKAHLNDTESAALQAVMRRLLAEGKALLLVDGLDEIAEVKLRANFCQQIEKMQIAFPRAPMVVTSRIVGYREMRYKIDRGFEHATIAEFSKNDKDEFARRWCAVTEPPERREEAAEELIKAIHSTEQIKRLTGNPMLLTTMALVKRRVGKLPSRRAWLYWEAVVVLLNWRSLVDDPIDPEEALPQLGYIAYDMCRRGVQRLRKDEVLELMEHIRLDYSHLRRIKLNSPEKFLKMLERRTGLLIQSGEIEYKGRPTPVFEFRHRTFQEYMAALALVDGCYPGREKNKTPAHEVAPLAGETEERGRENIVKYIWQEVLRLFVACCHNDHVDDVLLAILNPMKGENPKITARPRAALAALCLADEPNVSDSAARQVLRGLVEQVNDHDGEGAINTVLDEAAFELVGSEWGETLCILLIEEFCKRKSEARINHGGLIGMMGAAEGKGKSVKSFIKKLLLTLNAENDRDKIGAALTIMSLAYERKKFQVLPEIVEGLLTMMKTDSAVSHAGAWALGWLLENKYCTLTPKDRDDLVLVLNTLSSDVTTIYWVCWILGRLKESKAVEAIIAILNDHRERVSGGVVDALGVIGDPRAVIPLTQKLENEKSDLQQERIINALGTIGDPNSIPHLMVKLDDEDENIRKTALGAIAKIRESEIEKKLLSWYFSGKWSWIDPHEPIDEERVKRAAQKLKMSIPKIRQRYEKIAKDFEGKIKLSWQNE